MGCTRGANLLSNLMCNCRYLHSKNKEALSGHPNPTKSVETQWWPIWSSANYDPQHSGSFGCWRSTWSYVLNLQMSGSVDLCRCYVIHLRPICMYFVLYRGTYKFFLRMNLHEYSMDSALGSLSLLKSQTCRYLVIISGGSLIVKLKSS